MTEQNATKLDKAETLAFGDRLLEWSSENFFDFPWRRHRSPYEILVAELLLKRTTATAAARVYEEFLGRFPSLQEVSSAEEHELVEALSGLGLQHQRAHAMKRLANWLLTYEDGSIPSDIDRLLAVPGLGSYSASAILSFGFDVPIAILDVNVERILSRMFGNRLPDRPSWSILNEIAQELLPADQHREFNFGLLDLGRQVCRYVEPRCVECPLNSDCDFYNRPRPKSVRDTSGQYRTEPISKLRSVRIEKGLSLQRLAEAASVSKLTIIRIEAGRSSPKRETLLKLANALGIGLDQLT